MRIPFRFQIAVLGSIGTVATLSGCGGSQPMAATPGIPIQASAHFPERPLHGYYLANLTTEVGYSLPQSTLCIHFKTSGHWSTSGSENFNGTYFTSGKGFWASGVWLPSPPVFLGLIGSIGAEQGSGKFVVSTISGYASGGGTFTMTRKHNKACG